MKNTSDNNTAALIHLSALTQYIIPFGNFIFPLIIWSASKERSEYVDRQGKEAVNFQLSIFVYTMVLALIAIPIFIGVCINNSELNNYHYELNEFDFHNVTGLIAVAVSAAALFFVLLAAQFFLVIYATVKTSSGDEFRYPATIRFIK